MNTGDLQKISKIGTHLFFFLLSFVAIVIFFSGCAQLNGIYQIDEMEQAEETEDSGGLIYPANFEQLYYEQFARKMAKNWSKSKGISQMSALMGLPKDPYGMVNWSAAVYEGYISPLGGLGYKFKEEKPLKLNVFIEAKTPLMFNVIFPHEIHSYWLSCKNCHPSIFIDKAGANPITMNEILKGKWCGRCHGKVAFPFWPKSNCNRCHVVPKGMSLQPESF